MVEAPAAPVRPAARPTQRPRPKAVKKPLPPLRYLPPRDPTIVRGETLQVLSSARLVRSVNASDESGANMLMRVALGCLAAAFGLLLVASFAPVVSPNGRFGELVVNVRAPLILIAGNILAAAALAYLLMAAVS